MSTALWTTMDPNLIDLTNEDHIAAILASTMATAHSENANGEPEYNLYLVNGETIDVTWESYGLDPDDCYWSLTVHSDTDEFDATGIDIIHRAAFEQDLRPVMTAIIDYVKQHCCAYKQTLSTVDAFYKVTGTSHWDMLRAYDAYIRAANATDAYSIGWRPMGFCEFIENDYFDQWWAHPELDGRNEAAFTFVGSDDD